LRAVASGGWALLAGNAHARPRLEALLRQKYGSAATVLTDSGTSALTLALRAAARARPGRPVALPAYGCYDLATAVDGAGVGALLYDLDPATLGPDFESLRVTLRAGAGAIVVAPLYGIPVDLTEVGRLADRADAVVIEDAAQAFGMTWLGRPAGATGAYGVLSFGRGKGVTGGGGGALLLRTDQERVDAASETLKPAGGGSPLLGLAAQWALARPWAYGLLSALPLGLGETRYRPTHPPRGASDVTCAVVLRTLPLAHAEVPVRRTVARRLLGAARSVERLATVTGAPEGEPSFLRLPLLARGGSARLLTGKSRALGIMPGYPAALCDLAGFGPRVLNASAEFPGARALASDLFTLPTHGRLSEGDLLALEAWLASAR